MKKKTMKVFSILVLAMMMVSFLSMTVLAADGYDPLKYNGENSQVNTEKMDSIGQSIVNIITTAGSIISVIVLVVLGIKYMMGSAEEKAEYKKTLLPYIIGAAFVFAASTLASVIYNFASSTLVS